MGVLKIAEVGQGEDGNKIMYGWKMDIWGKIWGRDVGLGGKGFMGRKGGGGQLCMRIWRGIVERRLLLYCGLMVDKKCE